MKAALAMALVGLLVAGCAKQTEPTKAAAAPEGQTAPPSTPSEQEKEPEPHAPASADPPRASGKQMIVVTTDGWDAASATVRRFDWLEGAWKEAGASYPAVLGKSGLGWGVGLHGDGPPAGASGPTKGEGDGRAPAGMFSLADLYGYADEPVGTVSYSKATDSLKCVDDATSKHYNKIVDDGLVEVDWKSSENMRRSDELYRWALVVDHNRYATGQALPGRGSCIFFHVWRRPGSPTVGCTALAQDTLEELLGWLDPSAETVAVFLPRPVYDALATDWRLPALK